MLRYLLHKIFNIIAKTLLKSKVMLYLKCVESKQKYLMGLIVTYPHDKIHKKLIVRNELAIEQSLHFQMTDLLTILSIIDSRPKFDLRCSILSQNCASDTNQ